MTNWRNLNLNSVEHFVRCNRCGKKFEQSRYAEMAAHDRQHDEADRENWEKQWKDQYPKEAP